MNKPHLVFPLLLVLILLSYLTQLHLMELRGEEARRSLVAIEMLEFNNWIVPSIHDWLYLNKPPIWNWLLAVAITCFGSANEWVVRIPGVVSILLTGGAIFYFVKHYQQDLTIAILASLFFLTAVDLLYFGAVLAAEIDPFLTLLIFLQSMGIYLGFYHQKKTWSIIAWGILGIALLTKSLPPLVFFGFTYIGISIVERQWKWWLNWEQWLGVLLCSSIVVVYFTAYALQADVGTYLINLLDDSLQKSALETADGLIGHLFSFPFEFLKISLPWSLLLLLLYKKKLRASLWKVNLVRFSLIFIIANLWVYWISPETHNRYLYPFFPFVAIVAATIFQYFVTQKNPTFQSSKLQKIFRLRTAYGLIIVLLSIRIIYNFIILPIQAEHFHHQELVTEIVSHASNRPIYLTGEPFIQIADPSIAGFNLQRQEIILPPQLSFRIPYYLYLQTGNILAYHPDAKTGQLYLIYADNFLEENGTILHRFHEYLINKEMLLVEWGKE